MERMTTDARESVEDRRTGASEWTAEVNPLCAALSVNRDVAAQLLRVLKPGLSAGSAVSNEPGSGSLGIMTQGSGQAHAYRTAQFMGQTRVSDTTMERFLRRVHHVHAQNMAIKTDIVREGVRMVPGGPSRPKVGTLRSRVSG